MSFGIPTIPLPPMIEPKPNAPIIDAPSSSVSSPILLLISKDLGGDDLDIIREFGSVMMWKESYANVPFKELNAADYLIIDIRLKSARIALGKEDLKAYDCAHYVSWIQKGEEFIQQIEGNAITSIPKHCVNKKDFDNALLNPKIISPSLLKSIFRLVVGCFKK